MLDKITAATTATTASERQQNHLTNKQYKSFKCFTIKATTTTATKRQLLVNSPSFVLLLLSFLWIFPVLFFFSFIPLHVDAPRTGDNVCNLFPVSCYANTRCCFFFCILIFSVLIVLPLYECMWLFACVNKTKIKKKTAQY